LVSEEPPAALVDAETRRMAEALGRRLDAQGIPLQRYLNAIGSTVEQVVGEMRAQAVPAVKADLALRAVADDLAIEPSEADMDGFMDRLARQSGVSPETFKRQVERAGQRLAVRSNLRKSKAFDWLVEHAEVTDEEGNPVDRALLTAESDTPDAGTDVDEDAGSSFSTGEAGGPASLELASGVLGESQPGPSTTEPAGTAGTGGSSE
jgi:trigger factor